MVDGEGGQVGRTDLISHRDAESVGDRCEYLGAFMSADDTPATILCLPWKDWTVNSSRIAGVDPLTADQRDQWRRTAAGGQGEDDSLSLSREPSISSHHSIMLNMYLLDEG